MMQGWEQAQRGAIASLKCLKFVNQSFAMGPRRSDFRMSKLLKYLGK